LQLFIVIKVYT